jgi:hypothetical protein
MRNVFLKALFLPGLRRVFIRRIGAESIKNYGREKEG